MDRPNVYILTQDSKGYTDQGCQFIRNMLYEEFNETNDLQFMMGAVYNDPVFLAECIEKDEKAYIAVSTAKGIAAIADENVEMFTKDLKTATGKTSWEVAFEMLETNIGPDWPNINAKKRTRNLYIVTETGKPLDLEELKDVMTGVARTTGWPEDRMNYGMKSGLSDPVELAKIIEENSDCFLTVIADPANQIFSGLELKAIREILLRNTDKTSWQVITDANRL